MFLLFLLRIDRSGQTSSGELKWRILPDTNQLVFTHLLDDKESQRQLFQEFSRARLMGNGNSFAAELLFNYHDRGVVEKSARGVVEESGTRVVEESGRRVVEGPGREIIKESDKEVFEEISNSAETIHSTLTSSDGRVDYQPASQTLNKASVTVQTAPMKNQTRCDTDLDRLASGVVLGEFWALQSE